MTTGRYDFRTLFPDDLLIAYANRLLEGANTGFRVTEVKEVGFNFVRMTAEYRGRRMEVVAPSFQPRTGIVGFRSILKTVSKPATWLTNGQAHSGTSEIAWYGESGWKLKTTREFLRAYYESGRISLKSERYDDHDRWVEERMASDAKLFTDVPTIYMNDMGVQEEPLFPAVREPTLKDSGLHPRP